MAALSIHASYRCGQTGLCCATPWDVPVEAAPFEAIEAGRQSRRLPVVQPFSVDAPPPGYAAVLRREADGACACLDRSTRLCTVHGVLGEQALPTACRLFPRIARTDALGTVVTLSHYCPTAARLLLRDDVRLAVVEAPPAFPPGDYDGLVADDLPPLLHPHMLMGYDDYAAWEAHAVAVCAAAPTVWTALATLTSHAERMRTWRPGAETLLARLHEIAGDGLALVESPPPVAWFEGRMREVMEAVPAHLQRSPLLGRFRTLGLPGGLAARGASPAAFAERGIPTGSGALPSNTPGILGHRALPSGRLVRLGATRDLHHGLPGFTPEVPGASHAPALRYLAAHAMGNWCAYQGRGLRTYVRSLEAAAAVLVTTAAGQVDLTADEGFIAAVRDADLLLRHLASSEALATVWSQREGPAVPTRRGRFRRTPPR